MTARKKDTEKRTRPRKEAEVKMKVGEENFPNLSPEEIRNVLHELRTHQIELELQNEELRRSQAELAETHERLTDLYDFAPIGYITLSDKGIVLEANHTASEMLGLARVLLIGQPFSAFVADEDQDIYYLHLRNLFEAVEHQAVDLRMQRKTGGIFWAKMDGIHVDEIDGSGSRLRIVISDISERKRVRIKSEDDRIRYTELVKHISNGVAVYEARDNGRDFVFLDFNPAAERIDGVKKEALIGRNLLDVFPGVKDFGLFDVFQRVWRTGEPEHHPISVYKDDRLTGWRENYVYRLPSGEIVAVYDDVSERKKAESLLRRAFDESQQRWLEISALLKSAQEILRLRNFELSARSIFDSCKKITGATAGYVALLSEDGSENEVLFLDSGGFSCQVDSNLPMPIRGLRAKAYEAGRVVYENNFPASEWPQYLPKGHVRLQNVMFAPLLIYEKVVGLLGLANKPEEFTANDARIASAFAELAAIALFNARTLELLENSEKRYRSVVQTANDAIISINSRGKIISWNPRAEQLFGYAAAEALGRPSTLIMPDVYQEKHQRALSEASAGKKMSLTGKTVEMVGRRKDGAEFPLELSIAGWNTKEKFYFTGIIRDITERKQAEEALRESAEKIKLFAYSVAHDLKNPAIAISGLTKHLKRKHRDVLDEKGKTLCDQILKSTELVSALVNEINTYISTKESPLAIERVNLREVLDTVLDHFADRLNRRQIRLIVPDYMPEIMADRVGILRVVMNLFDNALKYGGDTLSEIIFHYEDAEEAHILSVGDDGVGIAQQNSEKIFGLFKRDHPGKDIEGVGLGLAIVKEIAEQHGGKVWVEPGTLKGITFHMAIAKSLRE